MNDDGLFPLPPTFTAAEFDSCRKSGDYCPILFEWYKYTGLIANTVASVDRRSPAAKPVLNAQYGALVGLLNRCSRLMLSNVALSHGGFYGETTAIIDRCIFESCVKVQWLCSQASNESFGRYIAEGLKTELKLKDEIEERIAGRGGAVLPIERRMLDSIQRYISASGLTDGQISGAKKLPDLASMLESLGHERLSYVVGQKIGSHHVHGTWASLMFHYLEQDDDGTFRPRDHNVPTHVNQYVFIPLMVISASKAFSKWLMDEPEASALTDMLQAIVDEFLEINREVIGDDFSLAEEA